MGCRVELAMSAWDKVVGRIGFIGEIPNSEGMRARSGLLFHLLLPGSNHVAPRRFGIFPD